MHDQRGDAEKQGQRQQVQKKDAERERQVPQGTAMFADSAVTPGLGLALRRGRLRHRASIRRGDFLLRSVYRNGLNPLDAVSDGLHQRDAGLLGLGGSGYRRALGIDLSDLLLARQRALDHLSDARTLINLPRMLLQGQAGSAQHSPQRPLDQQAENKHHSQGYQRIDKQRPLRL